MEKKRKINLDLLFNIAVLILGLLGSSIFDALTNTVLKTELRIVVIVSVLGCIILIITATIMRNALSRVEGEIHTIAERVNPSFELLPYEGNRTPFKVTIDLLKEAKEVVILDYFPWGASIDSRQDKKGSDFKKYYDALDEFIERGGRYLRIIQLQDGGESTTLPEKVIGDPVVTAHLNNALAKSKKLHSSVSLKTCQIFMPQISFMVIDQHYLDWEIASIDTENVFEFSQDFFIDDPNKKVIPDILSIIDQIDNKSIPVHQIA